MATSLRSAGYKKKPTIEPASQGITGVSRQSGGTSGDLSIPGYKPKTPTGAPYNPSEPGHAAQDFATAFAPREAHEAAQKERHEVKVQRAEQRQARIVDKYVTKAYSPKQPKTKAFSLESNRVKKTKGDVSATREKLLSHPVVQKANEEGKVVGLKGLNQIRRESKALTPNAQLTTPHPSSPGMENRQAKKYPGVTKLEEISKKKQEEGAPSTLEALGYASIGIPGIGLGGDVAKLGEAAAEAVPKLFAEGGAKQAVKDAAESVGGKAAAKAAAVRAAPRAAVQAAKDLPNTLRAGVKEIPDVLKAGARATPKFAGRKGVESTEKTLQGFSGIAALGGAHKAGINLPGGAILEGQGKALEKDPLKVLSSTANVFPGLLTGAFQLPVAAGASAITGSPAPLEGALKEQGNFVKHLADTYGSSDASKIEKATLQEGLLPEILAGPLAAKGVSLGKDLAKSKGLDLSETIKSRRAPVTDEQGNIVLHEHGGPVKKGNLRTGAETKLTRPGERNVQRREEAFHAATANDLTQLEFHRRREEVDKYARKAAGQKTPVRKGLGKKGKDTLYERAPDYIPFLVRAGIDLSKPEAAAKEIAHYADRFKDLKKPHELGATPEALTSRDAVRYFTEHPEKLKDKNLAKAVEVYRGMANGEKGLRTLSTSERNRYLAFAAAHDVHLPEERVPIGAREHTEATTREGAWEDLKGREKQVKQLRREAKTKRDQARVASPSKAAQLRREAKVSYAKAKTLEKGRQELLDGLKNYTRPWAKANPNAKRIPYDDALEKEFADESRKGLTERGLHPEPAYVPDSAAILKGTPDQSATGGKKPLEGAPKINEGYVWKNGLSRQGYEHLMNEGILRPVSRAYQFEDWRRFRDERGLRFEGSHQHTGQQWQKAFDRGVMNPRDVALVPTQVVNRLEKTVKGGDPTEYEQALSEIMASRKVSPRDAQSGTLYEAFPKAAYDEKVAQAQKSPISPILRHANSLTSRTMLSTPAFIGAQAVAETAQGIAEVNPGRMVQGLRAYNSLTPEQKLRISGVGGETAKAIFSPEDLQTTLGSYESKSFGDALSFFRRNVLGRTAKSVATMKWAQEIDRLKGSVVRRGVLTGQIARDVNGFGAKARRLLNTQTETQKILDDATKGLRGQAKVNAATAYLADHPRVLDKYQKDLHEAMGGWGNLTRTGHVPESYRAAALVFYPFLRMSLQWPIKYAINHPIKATALAYLATENNFALKEALHGEPSFLNYAQIPVYGVGKDGKGEIINLSRIAPGGNAITEAIQGSGSPLGAIQPVIAAGITGATGQGTYGPVEGGLGEHLKAAGSQILGLSPYVRAADTLRGQKASGQSEFGILAKRANIAAEPLAALEAKLKGSPQSQLERSVINPFKGIPTERAADYAKLGHVLGALAANSKEKQNKTDDKSTVLKMRGQSEKAENELNALYKKYGVTKVAKLSEEVFNYAHPYPGSSEGGIYGQKTTTESIYGPSSSGSTSIYGSSESAPVVPHETSGVSLSIPKLPGLGGVTGAIGSLVGGTPAQAAETPQSKNPLTEAQAKKTLEAQGANPALAAKGAANPKVRAQLASLTAKGYGVKTKAEPKKVKLPNIEGFEHSDQKEFAQWLSHFSKIPPKLTGEWVKQEGGGYSNGGEAGKNNWLGVGYPAHPTSFSESSYFNGTPKQAAKATAEWMEGKIGSNYDYQAAESIQGITALAKSGASESQIRSYIEGPSAWGTGAINTAGTISVDGKTTGAAGGIRVPYQAFGKHVRRDLKAVVKSKGYADTSSTKPITIKGAHGGTLVREVQGSSGVAAVINKNKDPEIAARLLLLSAKTGQPVYVLSGARTPAQSEAVGGFPDDPHTKGEAFDIGVGAPTLQSAAAIPESVYESVGLYRPFGTAQGGSASEDNHVQLLNNGTPSTGSYEPGAPSVGGVVPSGAPAIPGLPTSSSTPTASTPAKRRAKAAKTKSGETPLKRLQAVERIFAGKLPTAGVIPGFEATQTSTTPDLAAIGKAVEESRKKLIAA